MQNTAQKIHINTKTGRAEPCNAKKGRCPFGTSTEHFNDYASAQRYADKMNEEVIQGEREIYNFYNADAGNKFFTLEKLAKSSSFLSRLEAIHNGYYTDDFLTDECPKIKMALLDQGIGSVELKEDWDPDVVQRAMYVDKIVENEDRQQIEWYNETAVEAKREGYGPPTIINRVRDALTRQEIRNRDGYKTLSRERAFGESVATGGVSYDPIRGRVMTAGLFMSGYQQYSECVDRKDYTQEKFNEYIEKHTEFLKNNPGTLIGVWHDKETDKVFLDISKRTLNSNYAEQVCKSADQIAYFDLTLFEEVIVNRNATSGGKI